MNEIVKIIHKIKKTSNILEIYGRDKIIIEFQV